MISPHGGKIIDRTIDQRESEKRMAEIKELPRITVTAEIIADIHNIACGVYSPLTGFHGSQEVESIVKRGRLPGDLPWTIPILLPEPEKGIQDISQSDLLVLEDHDGVAIATMEVRERFSYSLDELAEGVFGTTSKEHPGVSRLFNAGDRFVAGDISYLDTRPIPFHNHFHPPVECREIIKERGWRSVAAFQTRNPPHIGHENLQKMVLSMTDGLMIQPVIGRKKPGDFKDDVIIRSYQALMEHYYPPERVMLNILPMEMRYAGPKEAIHHAILRKNFGCTHLIVGRDHAGVGNFYHAEAAIDIFKEYPDLEIEPATIRGDFFFCHKCGFLASERTCPHSDSEHLNFNGSQVRKWMTEGKEFPPQVLRPEVVDVIRKESEPFVK